MTDRRMYRYLVPVDDQVHVFTITGDPVAVAGDNTTVEFWAERSWLSAPATRSRTVRPRTSLGLVWHLFEMPCA